MSEPREPREIPRLPGIASADTDALTVALDVSVDPEVALAAAVAVFRVLAHPKRLMVLRALTEPKTVAQLRVECEISDPGSQLLDLSVVGLVERVAGSYPKRWQRVPGSARRLDTLRKLFVR